MKSNKEKIKNILFWCRLQLPVLLLVIPLEFFEQFSVDLGISTSQIYTPIRLWSALSVLEIWLWAVYKIHLGIGGIITSLMFILGLMTCANPGLSTVIRVLGFVVAVVGGVTLFSVLSKILSSRSE